MNNIHYIALDVHKKSISFCVKAADGQVLEEGQVAAKRRDLTAWAQARRTPWVVPWKRHYSRVGSTMVFGRTRRNSNQYRESESHNRDRSGAASD
jgi:hypothetical protein